jgi:hypothetical protein
MSESTGLVLAVGGLTFANEALFAPVAGTGAAKVNWRIVPATAVLAVALAGVDKVSPTAGKGIALIALVTVLFAKVGNAEPPLVNLADILGYGKSPPATPTITKLS